jgi:hypothetical membrane protein
MSVTKRVGAAAGFATPIIAFACIFAAIISYPAFSWTNNALSDLGVVSGVTGTLFNFGLIISGVLGFVFAVFGLLGFAGKTWVGKLGSAVFAAATVALILIGIFNEHFSPTHYLVSVAFFTVSPLALFILTSAFYLNGNRGLAAFTAAIGLAAAVPWILQFTIQYVPKVAIPETISALAVSIWAIVLSAEMLKTKKASPTVNYIF